MFRYTPTDGLTALHAFNGANGQGPAAELAAGPESALYGTTQFGGSNGSGTAFRVTPREISPCW